MKNQSLQEFANVGGKDGKLQKNFNGEDPNPSIIHVSCVAMGFG